jgi:hypothetical protein
MATQSPAVPLYSEELSVSRQQITGDTVQVSVVTHEGEGVVDEMLNHERVEIDRVPIDRPVGAIPPVRQQAKQRSCRWWKRFSSSNAALFLKKKSGSSAVMFCRMEPHSGSECQENR